jgi:hypothetical protein
MASAMTGRQHMEKNELAVHFAAYGTWRENLSGALSDLHNWLQEQELNDTQTGLRIQHMLERLHDDKLYVAFVAEFSRGKSELINAIFFADYSQRLLPSSPGRTTMCPTELLHDPGREPCIQLLPIETRATDVTTTEYKRYPEEWTIIPLDTQSSDAMAEALRQISQTKRVPVEDAERFGLYGAGEAFQPMPVDADGNVEIPCWRHAIINFPHPLLKQGLVILDTPGLNAIGTEPELTINLLPNAHAILFILAAETGVTKSDIEIWRNYIGLPQGRQKGRMAVLNKIDGLWDDLKKPEEVERDIARQVESCASLLGINASQVYPVSAQKGLLAKISRNDALLVKSRLPQLEKALSDELIPSKQEIVRDQTQAEIADILANIQAILKSRLDGVREQTEELNGLRDKNQDVILHMMEKVDREKEEFDKSMQRFQALQTVFSQQSQTLFSAIGAEALRLEAEKTRNGMESSLFTKNILESVSAFMAEARRRMAKASATVEEIHSMMESMYRKFSEEHGIALPPPAPFSILEYQKNLTKLERIFQDYFSTFNLIVDGKSTLINKFFDALANETVKLFRHVGESAEAWLSAIISPMETQVREHQLQLRRRMESIKRIHKATNTLEDRVAELQQMETTLQRQQKELGILGLSLGNALKLSLPAPKSEAASA